jgi:hypothetical protein
MIMLFLAILLMVPTGQIPEMTREEAIDLAIQALCEKEDLTAEGIDVVRADAVEWGDTSLGCPQEGLFYAQVITPGYRVALKARGSVYQAHVGGGRAVICREGLKASGPLKPGQVIEAPGDLEPAVPMPDDPARRTLVIQAKADLAKRLDMDDAQIELLELKDVVWPDRSLGCPKPGMAYPPVSVDGYRIRLRARKRTYSYHGGGAGRGPFLCENEANQ